MTWTVRLTRLAFREVPDHSFGPGIPLVWRRMASGPSFVMEVTPRGYRQLTGRTAPRVTRMHAAYAAKSRANRRPAPPTGARRHSCAMRRPRMPRWFGCSALNSLPRLGSIPSATNWPTSWMGDRNE